MSTTVLSARVTLYVPSTFDKGNPLPQGKHESLVRHVARQFSQSFGGATCTTGQGFYVADNGDLIEERVTLVTSYHALETVEALAIVIPIAQVIKNLYGQESIAIETEQGIQFI